MRNSSRNDAIVIRAAGLEPPRSEIECRLLAQIIADGLPVPQTEYRLFAEACGGPGKGVVARLAAAGLRDWRLDMAWPELRLFVEVDGLGIACKAPLKAGQDRRMGRHQTPAGFDADKRKLMAAAELGWLGFGVTRRMVVDGSALRGIKRCMELMRLP